MRNENIARTLRESVAVDESADDQVRASVILGVFDRCESARRHARDGQMVDDDERRVRVANVQLGALVVVAGARLDQLVARRNRAV